MVTYSKDHIAKANNVAEFFDLERIQGFDKWSPERKILAEEQFKYLKAGVEVGDIDGYEGPQTKYARTVFAARQNNDKVVETWRDLPMGPITPAKFTGKTWPNRSKWPLQNEGSMTKFYGAVGTNQTEAKLPYEMVIAWNPKQKLQKITCHRLIKDSVERIFTRTLEHYGYEEIVKLRLHYFGGSLNVRKMRGGSAWSIHSWGAAIDMDPDRNDLKTPWIKAEFSQAVYDKFWEFVYDEGAISLGIERNFDSMHFQFARLVS